MSSEAVIEDIVIFYCRIRVNRVCYQRLPGATLRDVAQCHKLVTHLQKIKSSYTIVTKTLAVPFD